MSRLSLVVLALTLGACLDGHLARAYPRWFLAGGRELRAGCAIADAFVRKSGKEGIGVTVELRSTHDCDARITKLALIFPDGARADGQLPAQAPLAGRSLVYLWVPIRFDGDAAWNEQRWSAALELELAGGGETRAWKIPAEERWPERWHDQWASP